MNEVEVLNDPTHECTLPPAGAYPRGTDIQCLAEVRGGAWRGKCGRKFTRRSRFWSRAPYWADYDYGW